jgi:superfamily II DNA or RNA helicase
VSRIWTPHSYQQQALDFLATRERANLFARMGSGKTAIILTWLLGAQVWSGALPVLILGPLRVARSVWSD